ncbi:MAG: adenylate/guanylate cyclase domain-containing protein [Leptolyngbyaceae cyanobacterium bins.349]|nr:adenylate/guanylate cyclase domain-containing protein [Leptolyngbyaceae cyanobacterium bins.349]
MRHTVWRWRGVLVAVPTVTTVVLTLRLTGLLQLLELATLDQLFLLRPQEPVDTRIVIVTIDEPDIQKLRQYPMTDATMARLLTNLRQHRPSAIGLDLYRDLPNAPGEADLNQILRTTPNLIGVQKVSDSQDSKPVAAPPILKQQDQVGANDLLLDPDGKVRRTFLMVDEKPGQPMFSFGLKLAYQYLSQRGVTSNFTPEGHIFSGNAVFQRFQPNDGGYVRSQPGGYQILINYRAEIQRFQTIGVMDVLENRIPPGLLRDRIVMIGNIAESHKDLFYTPLGSALLKSPTRTAGVVIHANLVSQILSAATDGRKLIQTLPEWAEWLWILGWTAIAAVISWQQRQSLGGARLLLLKRFRLTLAGACLVLAVYLAFLAGWWIPLVPTMLGFVGAAVSIVGYVAHNAAEMRRTFGRYLTNEVVANLLETPAGLKLGGERRKVTILVSDLRGFSAFSERLPPEQVVTLLNLYLGAMADVIDHYKGTINEFVGDGIFVLFGAPIARPDDAQRAIACAVAMQLAMQSVNEQNQQLDLPAIEMGIGINTGEVVVGNVGSQKRAKYTVIGSHVNLAARIESYTVGGQILISENVLQDADYDVQVDGQLQVEPKGIREPLTLYEVGGIGGKHNLFLPKTKEIFVDLEPAIALEFTILEGKHAVGNLFLGKLVRLAPAEAELQTDYPLELLSNLKIHILVGAERAQVSGDLYAKVTREINHQAHLFLIRFTAIPPEVAELLRSRSINPAADPAVANSFVANPSGVTPTGATQAGG